MRSSPLRSDTQRDDPGSVLAVQGFGRRRAPLRTGIGFETGSLMGERLHSAGRPGAGFEFAASWDLPPAPLPEAPACTDDAGW